MQSRLNDKNILNTSQKVKMLQMAEMERQLKDKAARNYFQTEDLE